MNQNQTPATAALAATLAEAPNLAEKYAALLGLTPTQATAEDTGTDGQA